MGRSTALKAISQLGNRAIGLNEKQLSDFASPTTGRQHRSESGNSKIQTGSLDNYHQMARKFHLVRPGLKFLMSLLLTGIASAQDPIDWKEQFEAGLGRDETVRERSRESGVKIIDRVCQEKLDQARVDLQGVAQFLLDTRDEVQLQASGMLSLIPMCRPDDSGDLLRSSIPALQAAALDESRGDKQRSNCVRALALLRPNVPSDLYEFFREVFLANQSRLIAPAALGLAKLTSKNDGASIDLHNYLIKQPQPDHRSDVVSAIGASQTTNEMIIRDLGPLLKQKDQQLTSEVLKAISQLGNRAVALNEKQLEEFASTSADKQSASWATSLLKRK